MKKLLYLMTVLLITQNTFAQQGKGLSNAVDNAGYCYVTGYITNTETGNDILVTKYDYAADTVWTRTYTGSNPSMLDEGIGIKTTVNGSIYVVGNIGNTNGYYDVVILKYSSDGTLLWDRVSEPINSELDDKAFGIAVD